jgi:anti-sigma factor RsiW
MRCSSCRQLLGGYLERELPHRARYHVVHHLRSCRECQAVLEEARAVDGLLATASSVEPRPNFTYAVMAEVRSLPIPYAHRTNTWLLLGGYVALAWLIIAGWLKLAGITGGSLLAAGGSGAAHVSAGFRALAEAAAHAFGSATPAVAAVVAGVLLLDLTVGAAFFAFYTIVRPRLAAELAYVRKV